MSDGSAPAFRDLPAELRQELDGDPDTLGLIVHGSRATRAARPDSDWDLIRVVSEPVYERLKQGGQLHEKRASPPLDVLYQSLEHLRRLTKDPGWWTATYASAVVVLDRTGEVARALEEMRLASAERAHAAVAGEYDSYLNCFVRSLKSWRRGDELGGRLHAAESGLHLIRTLCGLERQWPPYHDGLAAVLPELERRLGWESGSLRGALLALLTSGDPGFQQGLERRVEHLLAARGFDHEWGGDLELLQRLRFPPAGS